MEPRTKALLEAPIGPTLFRLALPTMVVMVVQSSVGLIETYFVAKLGTDALAGITLVFPILMLIQMLSAGAMGGGILSAVARALGSNRRDEANLFVWYAVAIAVACGIVTTVLALGFGGTLYAAMGGRDGSLMAALTYSGIIFAGAIPIWLFNSLAAVIRGTGNVLVPAAVSVAGAVVLIPLSPALIFGWGVLPHLGIVGGAVAVLFYYCVGSAIFAWVLWSGRTVLTPAARPPRLHWDHAREILRVGVVSSAISLSTNISVAVATGFVGAYGPAAVAGYGAGSRLEYLLVPIIFGLGAPLAAMVGTAVGAGRHARALAVAWTGAAVAAIITEAIGLAASAWPQAWIGLFSGDPLANQVGVTYLHAVGPFYGFFGLGLSLYFASQGAGRLRWPLVAATLRVAVATAGAWLAVHQGGGAGGVFAALAIALVCFGVVNAAAVWGGAWFVRTPAQVAATP
jgi:putative MATE family efflux protein